MCRCTRSGLKKITCPSGLAFDIEKQTCDWKAKVSNCDKKESKSQTKELLDTMNYYGRICTSFAYRQIFGLGFYTRNTI